VASRGSLVVVGTGINTLAHCSIEARSHIENAERLIVHVPDPLGMSWLRELHPNLIDLQACYQQGQNRADAYELMTRTIVDTVSAGFQTVAVFYGHPGVFVQPSHEAIRRLRANGYHAQMLPGISAEDCLFADLGIDPGHGGCIQHEASSYLFHHLPVDPSTGLILWQIGVLGDHTLQKLVPAAQALPVLVSKLQKNYPAQHQIVLYEAPVLTIGKPRVDWFALSALPEMQFSPASTLYIPPCTRAAPDLEAIAAMSLTQEQVFSPACTLQ
jgi:uroporphyrin-III C-methyltransferase